MNWGRPFRLPALQEYLRSSASEIVQIECGWTFSAALTKGSEVVVWWPYGDPMAEAFRENMRRMTEEDDKAVPTQDRVVPCTCWDLDGQLFGILPSIPDLPNLISSSEGEGTRLVQIAGLDNEIVGLTTHGHVLKFRGLVDETVMRQSRWEYVNDSFSMFYASFAHQN